MSGQHRDRAQVLVAVDATTKGESESTTNRYRVRLEVQRIDDRWLVAEMNQVG